jgi:hypothetical protein
MKLRAISDNILCTDADFGDYVSESGIVVKSNMGEGSGITPRWFKIWECGPEVHTDISSRVGWWVLVEYGRWTEGMELQDDRLENGKAKVWKVDPEACLALAETKENAFNYNSEAAWNR